VRFHQFDLNLLIYLDALLCEKSVSKAAARVNITQPAMSDALARLRVFFKDELLVNIARRDNILTELGQALVNPVREILLQTQSIFTATAEFVPEKSTRKFLVETSDYVYDILLRRVITRLYSVAPGVKVLLSRSGFDSPHHIKRAEVDLVIAPERFLADDLPRELLFADSLTCVVWSGNRLVGDKITFDQFMSMGHVCWLDSAFNQWFANHFGKSRNVEVYVLGFPAIFPAIHKTQRIASVYMQHAKMYKKQYSLRLIDTPFRFPPVKEYIQWHPFQERDAGLIWLRKLIHSVISEF
jgi:LysR family transcriptional regulator, nod-box dependent transcriptional activator